MEIKELNKLELNGEPKYRVAPDIGLDIKARSEITKHLKQVLADSYALMLKTQNYHWNVRGELFKPVHELTESNYGELFEAIDMIAERVRSLGETAPGSFGEYAALSNLAENKYDVNALEMAADLCAGHETVVRHCRLALDKAAEFGDESSVDLLTERLRSHEKTAWMWRSFIEK